MLAGWFDQDVAKRVIWCVVTRGACTSLDDWLCFQGRSPYWTRSWLATRWPDWLPSAACFSGDVHVVLAVYFRRPREARSGCMCDIGFKCGDRRREAAQAKGFSRRLF